MEMPVWRHLLLAGMLVVVARAQRFVPAEAASSWQTLAPGMEIRRVQSRKQSPFGDSRIAVLRIDPSRWDLEVMGVLQTGDSAGHTAREWAQKQQYTAVINAGMFETDNKTHLGYVRIRDHVYNGRVNSYQSMMAFDRREGKNVPHFRIFDLDAPGGNLEQF